MKKFVASLMFVAGSTLLGCSQGVSEEAPSASTVDEKISETMTAMSLPEFSGEWVWSVNPEDSQLSFSGTQEGKPFTGTFKAFDVAVDLDPFNPESGSIHAIIDMNSSHTKDSDRDGSLPGSDWFAVKKFPQATFVSSKISGDMDSGFMAEGVLTIKGVKQNISLPFSLNMSGPDNDTVVATGAVTLNRSDFNVGEGDYATDGWIAYPVAVSVTIAATR